MTTTTDLQSQTPVHPERSAGKEECAQVSQSQPETSAKPVVNESRVATVNQTEEIMNGNLEPEKGKSS